MLLAFIGACSGSVGGGIKAWRINILIRLAFDNITKIMHPTAVSTIKFNGEKIEQKQIESVFSFVAIYVLISILFLLALMLQNIDFYSAFSAVSATLNNLGPGLGQFSDNYSSLEPAGKITLSLAMIIGRLEIFGFLLLLAYLWFLIFPVGLMVIMFCLYLSLIYTNSWPYGHMVIWSYDQTAAFAYVQMAIRGLREATSDTKY